MNCNKNQNKSNESTLLHTNKIVRTIRIYKFEHVKTLIGFDRLRSKHLSVLR